MSFFVEEHIRELNHSNWRARREAASFLGTGRHPEAVDPLIRKATDPIWDVRAAVAEALGNIGDKKAVPALEGLLDDPEPAVSLAASVALEQLGSPVVGNKKGGKTEKTGASIKKAAATTSASSKQNTPERTSPDDPSIQRDWDSLKKSKTARTIIERLNSTDENSRLQALHELVDLHDSRALLGVTDMLSDNFPRIRDYAAQALGELEDKRAVPFLISAISDQHSRVREAAAGSLGSLGDKRAVNALIELLASGTTGDKNAAAIALGMIKNPQCTEELVEVLEDKVPGVRASAAWALGEIGAKKATDSLIKLLKDPNMEVRANSAEALGKIKASSAREALERALSVKGQDSSVVSAVIQTIAEIGDKRSADVLVKALAHPDPDIRSQAAWAIGELKSKKALKSLSDQLEKEKTVDVRLALLSAMGKINMESALSYCLEEAVGQEERSRRQALEMIKAGGDETAVMLFKDIVAGRETANSAEEVLMLLGNMPIRPLIDYLSMLPDTDGDWAKRSVQKMASLVRNSGQSALDLLGEGLGSRDEKARMVTVEVLLEIGTGGFQVLDTALKKGSLASRKTAAGAMGRLGGKKAIASLAEQLRDEESVRQEVVSSLLMIGAPAVPFVVPKLADDDKAVRQCALGILMKVGVPAVDIAGSIEEMPGNREGIWNLLTDSLGSRDERTRELSMEILLSLDRKGFQVLEITIKKGSPLAKQTAAAALGRVGGKKAAACLADQLGAEPSVREEVIRSLIKISAPSTYYVMPSLSANNVKERQAALEVISSRLRANKKDAVTAINDALSSEDKTLVEAVQEALLNIGSPGIDILIAGLRGTEGRKRRNCAEGLRQSGEMAHAGLVEALKDNNAETRKAALWAASSLGNEGTRLINDSLSDESSRVRRAAALLIKDGAGNSDSIEPLAKCLDDEDEEVKRMAALALGAIGDAGTVPKLFDSFKKGGSSFRKAVAVALGSLGNPSIDFLEEKMNNREGDDEYAALALAAMGAAAIPRLVHMLPSDNRRMGMLAAAALVKMGDAAYAGVVLSFEEEDTNIRKLVAESFANVGDV